jgi:hypothetical protein
LLIIVIKDLNVPKLQSFSNLIVQQAINLMREPYMNFRCISINTHIHSHTKRYNNIYYNRVLNKVTLSITPYPHFQWYSQTNEILLNLSMKCWNSAFNARFENNYNGRPGRSSENICSSNGGAQGKKERQDETQFTTKIGGKTSLGPSHFVL